MSKRFGTLLSVGVLAILIFAVYVNPASSRQDNQATADTFEYGQLVVRGDLMELGDNGVRVRWVNGGINRVPQFVTVESLIRILSRKVVTPTFGNLLNAIGEQGWELQDVRENSKGVQYYVFKRRY